jgi:branched-chain amino acid transport system permease protein
MTLFIQLLVDGLVQGSLYGALALAIVLVNQATGLINFSQGGMALFGSYVGMSVGNLFIPSVGPIGGIILGIVGAILVSVALGAIVERFLMRRFERAEEDTKVVATIGVLTLLGGLVGLIWGFAPTPYPFFFGSAENVRLGDISVSVWSIVTFITILALMGVLQLLFRGTKLGLGLRAVADNASSAALSGIRIGGMRMVGWGLAAALGTSAGILIAAKSQLVTTNFDAILVFALAAVVVGGLDSPVGVVVAALAMAVLESLAGAYVAFLGTDLKSVVPFVIIFVVLAIRPQGLFGRKSVVRV